MTDFAKFETEDRRLSILRVLEQSSAYAANEYLLAGALESLGHGIGYDRLRSDLDWLAEQDLVEITEVADVWIAALTRRGSDVGHGAAQCPGVRRPRPGRR